MPLRTSHPAGTFCAVDLVTPDVGSATAFYARLFAWEPEDVAVGGGGRYTSFRRGGRAVGGAFERPGPPAWVSYVAVAGVDAVARRAGELGGTVVAAPADVGDAGRTAVVADPQGATVALWQAGTFAGAEVVNEHGALTWNDLVTPEPEAAAPFYTELFGWAVTPVAPGVPYWSIAAGGRPNGGIMEQPPPLRAAGVPPQWVPYFAVDDLDAAVDDATDAGARVLAGKLDD